MPAFNRYVGIDYSGAKSATHSLAGLRVYMAVGDEEPIEEPPPSSARKYWSRRGLAEWLVKSLKEDNHTIVGIDHGFSFPIAYFEAHGLVTWTTFLDDLRKHWPTDSDGIWVRDLLMDANGLANRRRGCMDWFRLTEVCVSVGKPKSVMNFDVKQGNVAYSTHAGIPWIGKIRDECGGQVHFWPFDGWRIDAGRSAVVEVYPALWSKDFPRGGRNPHQHDAYSVAAWLSRADRGGRLGSALCPTLSLEKREQAMVEGWILGVGI